MMPNALKAHLIRIKPRQPRLLPDLVIPSISLSRPQDSWQFSLTGHRESQRSVPFGRGRMRASPAAGRMTSHLDYFVRPTPEAGTLQVPSFDGELPADCGLYIARRPVSRDARGQQPEAPRIELAVPELSQMRFEEHPDVIRRLCAPTCLSMVVSYFRRHSDFETIRRLSYNHSADAYGIWPQLIYASNRFGLHGAVLLFNSLQQLHRLISSCIPVIVSLRFSDGRALNFPYGSTRGHMVVVRGFSDNMVIVNDPVQRHSTRQLWPADVFLSFCVSSRVELGGCGVGLAFWPG